MASPPSGKKIVLRIGGSVLGSPPQAKLLKTYADVISEARNSGNSVGVVVGEDKSRGPTSPPRRSLDSRARRRT